MSAESAARSNPASGFQQRMEWVREVLNSEAQALRKLAHEPPPSFPAALTLLEQSRGNIIVTGMGKAGLIGSKLAATFASTGSPSHFLHPAEALHGDLGRVQAGDVVVALSYSGETEELVRLVPALLGIPVPIIAITSTSSSALASGSSIVLELGTMAEAGHLGLAPSTSTTAMLAVGDALALVLARLKRNGSEDFARSHPAGNLGRKLTAVTEMMRPLGQCRIATDSDSVRQVFVAARVPGRRSGAVMLVNEAGILTGLFTDSDLARLLEKKDDRAIDLPVSALMTRDPITIPTDTMMPEAMRLLAERRISELPVVDDGRPVGMLDITDLIDWLPPDDRPGSMSQRAQVPVEAPSTVPFSQPTGKGGGER